MAVDLAKLVSKRKLDLAELNNKVVAVDAYNVLYQFLSIIRGPDGTPLTDSHRNVTSHLSGILYRNAELIGYGVRPIYVFDGIPSVLKTKTIQARMKRKEEAQRAMEEALSKGKMEEAKMYAQGTTRITKEIIESSKELLTLMGIPFVNAPSEGEAQACKMCIDGHVYAVASQDYDTMLFGAPRVTRNLTISGKRKLPRKNIYINVEPELMSFEDTLKSLEINHRQLIWIGILLGTDFNDGVDGVGPKTALKIAKSSNSLEDVIKHVREKYKFEFEIDVKEVENLFLHPEVKEIGGHEISVMLNGKPNKDGLIKFMCDKHDFSVDRVEKVADRIVELKGSTRQKGMGDFLK